MSDHVPTFSIAVAQSEVPSPLAVCWDASALADARAGSPDAWTSMSRNNWHQHLLARCIEGRPAFSEISYLGREVAYLDPGAVRAAIPVLDLFLQEASDAPALVCRNRYWEAYGFPEAGEVREGLAAAVSRPRIDDRDFTMKPGFDSFFSFLKSSLSALQHAAAQGKGLVYVQFHG